MRVGVVFPQLEIGTDPAKVKAYAQAVEDLGYAHLVAFDHVLGADISTRPDWRGAYNATSMFHEVFVLFGFLAACTTRLELAPAILILPQRQAVLVAKQAAEVDVLTQGRTRLGVGLGWNEVEYQALGEKFRDRARRIEEQIEVLRLLFTKEVVDYTGRWHRIDSAGLNPLPVQRPIPIWMGGNADPAVRRIARIADGWFTQLQPDDAGRARLAAFRSYLREAGRDAATFFARLGRPCSCEHGRRITPVQHHRASGKVAAHRGDLPSLVRQLRPGMRTTCVWACTAGPARKL